ncbi:hypothetical protein F5J12DRAFT_788144 [Pisolithus orientalis]|uniref:uncharacterized protein n=1 Tax=Pisolithus orientalis TaxID=936130 RepID=UPI00222513F1|nr:uncharacterized protein F5J12DRAFT_788144 [Pisolithus orientalis]KAI5982687.1 hypothetical protein F5J12DRAFT_788144 [Pisolithus orientalis]
MDSPAPKPDGVGLMNTPDHYMYERRSVIATAKICMITHVWNNHVWARRTMDNMANTGGTALANLGQPLLDSLDPGSESSTPQLTPKGSSGVRHTRRAKPLESCAVSYQHRSFDVQDQIGHPRMGTLHALLTTTIFCITPEVLGLSDLQIWRAKCHGHPMILVVPATVSQIVLAYLSMARRAQTWLFDMCDHANFAVAITERLSYGATLYHFALARRADKIDKRRQDVNTVRRHPPQSSRPIHEAVMPHRARSNARPPPPPLPPGGGIAPSGNSHGIATCKFISIETSPEEWARKLDSELLAPQSRRRRWETGSVGKDCRDAYRRAIAEVETEADMGAEVEGGGTELMTADNPVPAAPEDSGEPVIQSPRPEPMNVSYFMYLLHIFFPGALVRMANLALQESIGPMHVLCLCPDPWQ